MNITSRLCYLLLWAQIAFASNSESIQDNNGVISDQGQEIIADSETSAIAPSNNQQSSDNIALSSDGTGADSKNRSERLGIQRTKYAQFSFHLTKPVPKAKIDAYGFIRLHGHWDSRQIIGSLQDSSLLYPAPFLPDKFGQDINAHPTFHMAAYETRIGAYFEFVPMRSLLCSGIIEMDFRGPGLLASDADGDGAIEFTNIPRLRKSWVSIEWKTGSVRFGQDWHPLFVPECYAHTVGYNQGAPIATVGFFPIFRVYKLWDSYEINFAIISQALNASPGPLKNAAFGSGTLYIRNAVVPNLDLQFIKRFKDNLVGFNFDYKRLVPRIVTDKNIKVTEQVNSIIVQAFAKFEFRPCIIRTKIYYGENGADLSLISGYAVRTVNPETDFRTYTPTTAVGAWFDFVGSFHDDDMELGLFAGYTKNIGARHPLHIDPITGEPIIFVDDPFAKRIDYVSRLSPRFLFNFPNSGFIAGFEIEWTRAAFGEPNRFARICNPVPVSNVRFDFHLNYVF